MSGYVPNPSEIAVSDDWHGEFIIQGNPHRQDDSCSSFNSQISQIFKHPQKQNLYIALADRWVPDYVMTRERYEWLSRTIASHFDNKKYKATLWDMLKLTKTPLMGSANTSISQYIWLPLYFDGEKAIINWDDEWFIEEFQ